MQVFMKGPPASPPLRPIQPKPSQESTGPTSGGGGPASTTTTGGPDSISGGVGGGIKKEVPLIRLTPSEDNNTGPTSRTGGPQGQQIGGPTSRTTGGGPQQLGGHTVLVQSVSQDSGLDSGIHLRASEGLTPGPTRTPSSAPGHCPVLRQGPALGCNFCWNSTDLQGRVLRRKTKYHCPECRTNLCIVPCFHEYHKQIERVHDTDKQITKILTKTGSM
ncbi:hypothetical protein Pcinc_040822 [Petrolisthes cinctipes]|uniref:PiggyBac transposable element-derived protein 4 n=1 Tax=Petrolisthes cinctipes TaxID=88211 RepID=A0AAE1EHM4_PETCI|nr:hypothetical protein Pcinc_040822 [Petrolisthes cinctipes]